MEDDNTGYTYTGYESAFVPTPQGEAQPSDSGDAQTTTINGKVTVSKTSPNVRRWNPLGEFSSYTYQISLFMITPDAYDLFIASGRQQLNVLNNLNSSCSGGGAYLIAQSGGINDTNSTRADGFNFDYYIDNLRMTGAINPQSTGAPAFEYEMEFTITEAYGFSFITNLKRAADAIAKYSKIKNIEQAAKHFSRQFFILGLRFLGYDKAGRLIEDTGQTHPRYYDILIKELKFKIDGRAVVYNIKATPIPIAEGMFTKRGMIDKGARNLTGGTVGEVLNALKTKLNNDQANYTDKITYNFDYIGPGAELIKNASIISPADVQKAKWPMTKLQNQSQVNVKTAQNATPVSTEKIVSFERELPITQAISQIVTQSTYLIDALTTVYKPTNEPDKKTDDYGEVEIQSEATVKWINVNPFIKNPRWSVERNDWIFDITYNITPYDTPMVINPAYIDKTKSYYGPIKRYRYWYTGENSEIIRYEQNFDNSFYNIVLDPNYTLQKSGPIPAAGDKRTSVARTGETGVGLEAQNSYVTSLYEPGAWATARLEILGDPDLLSYPMVSGDVKNYNPFYGPDGITMNPLSGQVFIEIDFKEAVDYNNSTGVMDINESILFWKYPPDIAEKVKGVSYMIKKIVSNFRSGKFTQDLECVVNTYWGADNTSSTTEREKAEGNNAETARFNRQPTGFVKDETPQNKTPGGDPCVRNPDNKVSTPPSIDDDAMSYLTNNPVDYTNLSDIRGP